ncbi:MAG: hypothetical protein AAGC67_10155 [Myxococcota bacterium]
MSGTDPTNRPAGGQRIARGALTDLRDARAHRAGRGTEAAPSKVAGD